MKSCLICATVLIAALLVLRPLLKRTSARLRYALWGLVLLRLMLPVPLMSSGISVMNFVEERGRTQVESPRLPDPQSEGTQSLPPVQTPPVAATPGALPATEPVQPAAAQPGETQREQADVLKIVWLAGSVAVGAWFLIGNLRFAHRLRKTRSCLQMRRRLPVYVVEGIPSPCLCGFFRPAIYLTPEVAAHPDRLAHVLAHETAHWRHLDHIWSVMRGLCLTVYWFHPLVWVAAWLSRRDCELACDETALRDMALADRIAYGRTLLALVSPQRVSPLRVATTMTAGKRELAARIRAVAQQRRTVVGVLLAALLLTAVAVGCTFTGAKTDTSLVPEVRFSVDGKLYTPQRGTTSWNSEIESFVADSLHPLDWDEALWAESTVTHDETTVLLEFDFEEAAVAVLRAWPSGAQSDAEPIWEQGMVNAARYWPVRVQSGMVYELQVQWAESDSGWGTAYYGIRVENENADLISPFDLKLLYADDERLAFMGPFGLCVYDLSAGELLGCYDLRESLGMNVCSALREQLINDKGRLTNYGVVLEGMATQDHRLAVHLRWIDDGGNTELLRMDTEKTVYMDLQTGEVSLGWWDESIRLDTGLQNGFDLMSQGDMQGYAAEVIPFADGSYGYICVGSNNESYPIDGLFYARGDQRWELHLDLPEQEENDTPPTDAAASTDPFITESSDAYPTLQVEYDGRQIYADVRVCSWQHADGPAISASVTHLTNWAEDGRARFVLNDVSQVMLRFSQTPLSVTLEGWPMSALNNGESATVKQELTAEREIKAALPLLDPGFYLVRAEFERGWLEFLFLMDELPAEADAGLPVLSIDYGGGTVFAASRPEIWNGIAYDALAVMQWAASMDTPTLYWAGTTEMDLHFSEEPISATVSLWSPDSLGTDEAPWYSETMTEDFALRADGSYYYLLSVEFEGGTAQYLFRLSQTDPDGARRIYGTDSEGVGSIVDYVSEDRLVFHGYYGLCVYDLEQSQLLCRVDFTQTLGYNQIQGGYHVVVEISADGGTALCHVTGDVDESARTRAVRVDLQTGKAIAETYTPLADTRAPIGVELRQTGASLCTLQYSDGAHTWNLLPAGFIPAAKLEYEYVEPEPIPDPKALEWSWIDGSLYFGMTRKLTPEDAIGQTLTQQSGRLYAQYHTGGGFMGSEWVLELHDDGSYETLSRGQFTFYDLGTLRIRYSRMGELLQRYDETGGEWVALGTEGWFYGWYMVSDGTGTSGTDAASVALIDDGLFLVGAQSPAEYTGLVRLDLSDGVTELVVDRMVRSFTAAGGVIEYEYFDDNGELYLGTYTP